MSSKTLPVAANPIESNSMTSVNEYPTYPTQLFRLLLGSDGYKCIQCSTGSGETSTLEDVDSSSNLNLWTLQLQQNTLNDDTGYYGVAFVCPATGLSTTATSMPGPLVVQPYDFHKPDQDSFWIVNSGANGQFRIAAVSNTSFSFKTIKKQVRLVI